MKKDTLCTLIDAIREIADDMKQIINHADKETTIHQFEDHIDDLNNIADELDDLHIKINNLLGE